MTRIPKVASAPAEQEEVTEHPALHATRPRLRGLLHAAAAIASLIGLVWMVRRARSAEALVAAWVYGIAAVLCYSTSFSYHALARTERARQALRRADHSMIYVLIAGTATPIFLLAMAGWSRWLLIGLVWFGAVVGIGACIAPKARLGAALYLVLGWAGVAALPALSHDRFRLLLLAIAGVLYTAGAVLLGMRRPRLRPAWFGYHEFWHGVGVTAGALLFVLNFSLIAR